MIIGNFKIESTDTLNVTVSEKYNITTLLCYTDKEGNEGTERVETGEIGYKILSWHPNYEKALNWIINRELNDKELKTVEEVLSRISELKELIEKVVL